MAQTPGMGWIPDIPDFKDYTEDTPDVAAILKQTRLTSATTDRKTVLMPAGGSGGAAAAAAPAPIVSVDLRQWCSPIEDQLTIGSCTANAAVALVEYFERRSTGKHIDGSRLFVYKTTRNLLRWTGDRGAYLRTAMGALVLFGVPPESYWPYDVSKVDDEPNPFVYALAQNFHSLAYFRLDPAGLSPDDVLANVKRYLASGFPSMFGLPVYDEFMHVPNTGLVTMPKPHSRLYGGHAIVAVGYDDRVEIDGDRGALLIRNSWGTAWGLSGYAWLSYKYVTAGLALDWWTNIRSEWVDTGEFA